MVNGYTAIAVTKLDILDDFDEIKIGVKYVKTIEGKKLSYSQWLKFQKLFWSHIILRNYISKYKKIFYLIYKN